MGPSCPIVFETDNVTYAVNKAKDVEDKVTGAKAIRAKETDAKASAQQLP